MKAVQLGRLGPLLVLLVVGPGLGAAPAVGVTHSGTIVTIDPAAAVLVIGEIGPWRIVGGQTQITRRTFTLLPSTTVVLVKRSDQPTEGFPGDWVETPLAVPDLVAGDFVTVEALPEGDRLTALFVTVVRPERR